MKEDPYFGTQERNFIKNNAVYISAGIFLGGIVLVGFIYFFNFRREDTVEELPTTGDDSDTELIRMNNELENIEQADEIQKIARVGAEYLFYTDLENYAYLTLNEIDELDYDQVVDELINKSIVLQLGETEGWIELETNVFNNPFKDFDTRNELYLEVSDKFSSELKGGTRVEQVIVWFYNMVPGELAEVEGIEAAKSMAYTKINEVYEKVKSGEMSMQEAGEHLQQDTSLAVLDEGYVDNVYMEELLPYEINNITDNRDDTEFGYKCLVNFLQSAEAGDLSEICLEEDKPCAIYDVVEAYYAFYKVKSKNEGFDTAMDWAEYNKDNFTIEVYEEID